MSKPLLLVRNIRFVNQLRLAVLTGAMIPVCLVALTVLYTWIPAQPKGSLELPTQAKFTGTPTLVTPGNSFYSDGSETFIVYPAPSQGVIATVYGGSASFTFSIEDTVVPKRILGSSTRRITWDYNEVMVYGYDGSSRNILTTYTIVPSNAPPIPEVSFKTVVPEPDGNSLVAVATPVAVGTAIVGSAVYRLQHFVGRLGVVIPSFSQEVFSISLFVFLGSAFVPLLLLRDSDFPSGFTTCITARGVSPVFTNFTIRSKEDVKTILLGHPRMVRRNWLRTASA